MLATVLAGCQSTAVQNMKAENFDEPAKAGETKARLVGIDPNKWQMSDKPNPRGITNVYKCIHPDCKIGSEVIYSRSPSPTRNPDPVALQKLRQTTNESLMKQNYIILKGSVTRSKGYPALEREAQKNADGKSDYRIGTRIFAGSLSITIRANSEELEVSRRNRDEFLAKLEIKDGGPAQAPAQ